MERLRSYGIFSDETLRAVEAVATTQASFETYHQYFASLSMPKPIIFKASRRRSVPVLDIPSRKKLAKGTIVIHLPMANPLDQNQQFHIATIASALPNYRIIAFGNPSGSPYAYRGQNRELSELFGIAFTSKRRALVSPELEYLHKRGITNAHHVGYSFGAHKAVVEAQYLGDEVASLTLVDPVAHPRGIKQLIHDFQSTFTPMGKYVDRTNLNIYFDARRDAAKTAHHKAALRRPISIAIGIFMARFDFMKNISKLLVNDSKLKIAVAWGSKSELGNDAHMNTSLHQLATQHPSRVQRMRLKDDAHALANDIHLYAALVYEALQRYNAK